jgi:hypothetical protein
MDLVVWGFPLPARLDQLNVGDIFAARSGEDAYLCMKVVDKDGEFYLALGGPEHRQIEWPSIVHEATVRGFVARLPPLELAIAPVGDALPQSVDQAKNGSLIIDGEGKPWLQVTDDRNFSFRCSLVSGKEGSPPPPLATFQEWRLMLCDGERRISVVSFHA